MFFVNRFSKYVNIAVAFFSTGDIRLKLSIVVEAIGSLNRKYYLIPFSKIKVTLTIEVKTQVLV